jgi:hypothetical protein
MVKILKSPTVIVDSLVVHVHLILIKIYLGVLYFVVLVKYGLKIYVIQIFLEYENIFQK